MLVLGTFTATAAPTNEPEVEPNTTAGTPQPDQNVPGVADGSPQFLYMQLLHDRLKDSKQSVPEKKDSPGGALLATSIEADTVTGAGMQLH